MKRPHLWNLPPGKAFAPGLAAPHIYAEIPEVCPGEGSLNGYVFTVVTILMVGLLYENSNALGTEVG